MRITIPSHAVPGLTARAHAAGFSDVEQFVLSLAAPEASAPPPPIDVAIEDGFASGVAEHPLRQFLAELRERVAERAS